MDCFMPQSCLLIRPLFLCYWIWDGGANSQDRTCSTDFALRPAVSNCLTALSIIKFCGCTRSVMLTMSCLTILLGTPELLRCYWLASACCDKQTGCMVRSWNKQENRKIHGDHATRYTPYEWMLPVLTASLVFGRYLRCV